MALRLRIATGDSDGDTDAGDQYGQQGIGDDFTGHSGAHTAARL